MNTVTCIKPFLHSWCSSKKMKKNDVNQQLTSFKMFKILCSAQTTCPKLNGYNWSPIEILFNPLKFCWTLYRIKRTAIRLEKPSNDPGAQVVQRMKLKRIINCVENWTIYVRCRYSDHKVNREHRPSTQTLITCLKLMNVQLKRKRNKRSKWIA